MIRPRKRMLVELFAALGLAACRDAPDVLTDKVGREAPSAEIAVGNSWLECCLRDLDDSERPRRCPHASRTSP